MALSLIIGGLVHVDPELSEVAARTRVGMSDIALALASGCAGALAFTTGVSATLNRRDGSRGIIAAAGDVRTADGQRSVGIGYGALSLFLVNLICINLAGVGTFLVQAFARRSGGRRIGP